MNVLLGVNSSRSMRIDECAIQSHTTGDDFAFVGNAFMFAGNNIREAVNVKRREVAGKSGHQYERSNK